ncbi:hypothetical protein HS1genome_0125 [Sulfodiicoccus acidiphilus]|uniref:Uncharacterized protein n=1 Tax=Sulfodiicoccus acidiphilus TaxID=1670455 RepID=A0A348B0N4_9CREN|nr:phosphoribosylformylglycinamidine synthase subunit PurS [Sulfodiicoccus acidiphilus]BBD71736.1 hypothetical protein HS1genome_0125 [Sulfodiicoccus acidiphilus]GGT86236.1 hypothetical protein GCM10007116_00210 [Sulfodiicoccus acidiphilus]
MNFVVDVLVLPKEEIRDPEGEAVKKYLLKENGSKVNEVRAGKLIRLAVDATSPSEAEEIALSLASKGLFNPLVHRVEVRVL